MTGRLPENPLNLCHRPSPASGPCRRSLPRSDCGMKPTAPAAAFSRSSQCGARGPRSLTERFIELLAVVDRPFAEDARRTPIWQELATLRTKIIEREELGLWVEGTFTPAVVRKIRQDHRADAIKRAFAEVEQTLGSTIRSKIDRTRATDVQALVLSPGFGDPEDPTTHRKALSILARPLLEREANARAQRILDECVVREKQMMETSWANEWATPGEAEQIRTLTAELAKDVEHLSPKEIAAAHEEQRRLTRELTQVALEAKFELVRIAGSARRCLRPTLRVEELLTWDHLEELERSTVSLREATAAGIFSGLWMPLIDAILREPAPEDDYLVIPYLRPGDTHPSAFRVKGQRGYRQPTGTPTPIYYPPSTLHDDRLGGRAHLVWTEGEKKALALDRMGYATVGVPGIWNFHDAAHRKATGELRFHPWIREDVRVEGRVHVIAYDPGLRTNSDVVSAARRLSMLLWRAGAADVRLVAWPEVPPEIDGVDDLAYHRGDDAVHELVAAAGTLPHGSIAIPLTVAGMTGLTAEQKVVYGALRSMADDAGRVDGVSMEEIALMVGKSRQTVSELLAKLSRRRLVRCLPGRTRRIDGAFRAEKNRYRLLGHTHHLAAACLHVRPTDLLGQRSACALVLAALRQGEEELETRTLARTTGMPPRTLRDALADLGPLVQRRRGVARLAR